jgi:hypothetical protein
MPDTLNSFSGGAAYPEDARVPTTQSLATPPEEDTGLSEDDWQRLLTAIRLGRCTPFLGSGASIPHVRGASSIAKDWARDQNFPFPNSTELIKVAQYLSVRFGPLEPKARMVSECDVERPTFGSNNIYEVLAGLNIPVFMTTNYDSLMAYALEGKGKCPRTEICRWQPCLSDMLESPLASGFRPDIKHPLVFHFHGHISCLDSLVLDEDDYLDFLKQLSKEPDLLPPQVQKALKTGFVLFLGYSVSDWTIQVLFRSITDYLSKGQQQTHLSVQLVPTLGETANHGDRIRAKEYLQKYFVKQNVSVYWGSCDRFASELRQRVSALGTHATAGSGAV